MENSSVDVIQCVNVQVHREKEKNARKPPAPPDIEDCSKYQDFSSLSQSYRYQMNVMSPLAQ